MADMTTRPTCPDDLWRAFGRHLAASTGALSALLSLVSGSTVTTACWRGGLALFGVLLATRIGAAALAGITSIEARAPDAGQAHGIAGLAPETRNSHDEA